MRDDAYLRWQHHKAIVNRHKERYRCGYRFEHMVKSGEYLTNKDDWLEIREYHWSLQRTPNHANMKPKEYCFHWWEKDHHKRDRQRIKNELRHWED